MNEIEPGLHYIATVPPQSAASSKRIALELASQLTNALAVIDWYRELCDERDDSELIEIIDESTVEAREVLEAFKEFHEDEFLAPGEGNPVPRGLRVAIALENRRSTLL